MSQILTGARTGEVAAQFVRKTFWVVFLNIVAGLFNDLPTAIRKSASKGISVLLREHRTAPSLYDKHGARDIRRKSGKVREFTENMLEIGRPPSIHFPDKACGCRLEITLKAIVDRISIAASAFRDRQFDELFDSLRRLDFVEKFSHRGRRLEVYLWANVNERDTRQAAGISRREMSSHVAAK